jgi:polar amino acid transport system permease protein
MSALTQIMDIAVANQAALLTGLWLTIRLLVLSSVIGIALAVPLSLGRTSRNPWFARPAYAYGYLFRGTPVLTQLFLLYYGAAQFDWVRSSALWPVLRDPWPCALIALSLNMAAYVGEVLRGGIQGVPVGEREAGAALGMTPGLLYRRIILPRAFGIALPAIGNEVVIQLKCTALVSTITLLDITGVARRIVTRTYSTDALFIAGAIYIALTWLLTRGFRLIEFRMNRRTRA